MKELQLLHLTPQPGRGVFRELCPDSRVDVLRLSAMLSKYISQKWPLDNGRSERFDSLLCLARALVELRHLEWDGNAQDCITAFSKTAWHKPNGKHINVARFERLVKTPTDDWTMFGDRLVEMIKVLRTHGQKFSPCSVYDLVWLRALWVDLEHVRMDYEANSEKHFPLVISSVFFHHLPAGPNHG
ncbi:hypothetical protein ACFFU8_17825 [Chromobacterium piscinae]|uniref:hypothetical protein n=1 Tax=Chromobacterium piscinae TaxID=686831 RepID=UPI001E3298A1|nr:hypothetical protein [Chromobacterium piscinae]MCD5329614.1 hypothetical protein [Chromobacterium piscinae]